MLPVLLFAGAALAQSSNVTRTEVHNGYTYILSGPKEPAPKDQYQLETCSWTIEMLSGKLGVEVPEYNNDPDLCLELLYTMKEEQGDEGLLMLLEEEIAEGDEFWLNSIAKSNPDSWVSADGRAVAFLPNLTALAFTAWSSSPFADAANRAGNAEHYIKRTEQTPTGLQSEILEGWGGVTTHFNIPNYGVPNLATHPMLNALPQFPYQAAGDKVLRDEDQTRFGVLHIAARDVSGCAYGYSGQQGVEIFATVWYQDGVDDAHLEDERQHIIIEIVNLSLQAQSDIESGAFVPPVLP